MIWLNPAALFALAAVAAPILIHILIQRRAERFPFPTLRFLQPTRLAAIRRHVFEDLALLAVRVALLAAAVAALAGPLIVTSARRQAWDRRIVRAVVVDDGARAFQASDVDRGRERPALQQTFEATSLADGIRRATLWLAAAPPARREIAIASALPIGSISPADLAAIPSDIGIRFERTGALPATRTVAAGRLLTADGVRARELTLAGAQTLTRETAVNDPAAWPIDVVVPDADRPAIDAAIAAVLAQRVWVASTDRRARLVLSDPAANPAVASITVPWMAAAAAGIARDPDLAAAAARIPSGFSGASVNTAPWQILARAADGRPLVAAAAAANRFVVASAAPASELATPVLLRSIANAIAGAPALQHAEVMPIADAQLQRWSRPSAPPSSQRIETVDRDDRRWFWLAVLALLALEMWMRRARRADLPREQHEDHARVA